MVKAATGGFGKKWQAECKGGTPISQPPSATQNKRRAEKLVGKSTWFKKQCNPKPSHQGGKKKQRAGAKNPNYKVEEVMVIPFTHFSKLMEEPHEVVELVNGNRKTGKIRFVERAGPRIRDLVCQKTP